MRITLPRLALHTISKDFFALSATLAASAASLGVAAARQLQQREKMMQPMSKATTANRHEGVSLGPDILKMERILFNSLKAFRTALVKKDMELAEELEQRSTQLLDKLRLKRRKVG